MFKIMRLSRNIYAFFVLIFVTWFICESFVNAQNTDKNIDKICNQIKQGHIDSCNYYINNFFDLQRKQSSFRDSNSFSMKGDEAFKQIDNFLSEIKKLSCVDTCYYYDGRNVFTSNPPQVYIVIIFKLIDKKSKYPSRTNLV